MDHELMKQGDILLYDNGTDKQFVSVVFKDETFWLTQKAMAELFECSADNISLHLKNIYAEEELLPTATTEKFSVVRKEGKRNVKRELEFYNLILLPLFYFPYIIIKKKLSPLLYLLFLSIYAEVFSPRSNTFVNYLDLVFKLTYKLCVSFFLCFFSCLSITFSIFEFRQC